MSINPPRATAVITAYNAERYVSRAIESALNQSFGPVHVIVVDDGSSDNTSAVARSYGDSVELIQLEENSGPAVGRTTGLMNCKTEFMAYTCDESRANSDSCAHIEKIMASLQKSKQELALKRK